MYSKMDFLKSLLIQAPINRGMKDVPLLLPDYL